MSGIPAPSAQPFNVPTGSVQVEIGVSSGGFIHLTFTSVNIRTTQILDADTARSIGQSLTAVAGQINENPSLYAPADPFASLPSPGPPDNGTGFNISAFLASPPHGPVYAPAAVIGESSPDGNSITLSTTDAPNPAN